MEEIMANSQDSYLHAQAEAMAYLEWLKKFAQAFLAGE
jgi:CRISPR-associated protein Cmr5